MWQQAGNNLVSHSAATNLLSQLYHPIRQTVLLGGEQVDVAMVRQLPIEGLLGL